MKETTEVECDSRFCRGAPRIAGTRITVHNVVTKLDAERSIKVTCEEYGITEKQVMAAMEYCSSLNCVSDKARENFCATCVLRNMNEREATDLTAFKNSKSISDLEGILPDESRLHPETYGWVTASELLANGFG